MCEAQGCCKAVARLLHERCRRSFVEGEHQGEGTPHALDEISKIVLMEILMEVGDGNGTIFLLRLTAAPPNGGPRG